MSQTTCCTAKIDSNDVISMANIYEDLYEWKSLFTSRTNKRLIFKITNNISEDCSKTFVSRANNKFILISRCSTVNINHAFKFYLYHNLDSKNGFDFVCEENRENIVLI